MYNYMTNGQIKQFFCTLTGSCQNFKSNRKKLSRDALINKLIKAILYNLYHIKRI